MTRSFCAAIFTLSAFAVCSPVLADSYIPGPPRPAPKPATMNILKDRIGCLAFVRALAKRREERLPVGTGWTLDHQSLWVLHEQFARFEQRNIRPFIDEETQAAVVETFWPDGILETDFESHAEFCDVYRWPLFLNAYTLPADEATFERTFFKDYESETITLPNPIKTPEAYGLNGD